MVDSQSEQKDRRYFKRLHNHLKGFQKNQLLFLFSSWSRVSFDYVIANSQRDVKVKNDVGQGTSIIWI